MRRTRDEILEEKRRLRTEYGTLFDSVAALLFRYDPVGINFEVNPDEYETETGTILPRLLGCQSVDDVRRVIHEEFCSLVRRRHGWPGGALWASCHAYLAALAGI